MSNVLKLNLQETIHTLRDGGWSRRRNVRELGIDRETVGRICVYQNQAFRPPTKVNVSHWPTDQGQGWLSAQRIYQDLVEENDFSDSFHA
jgi:hypothetical protein